MLKTSFIQFVSISISWISYLFIFFIFYLFLVNGPIALYVNPGCFKCIPGINLSLANKDLFTIVFIVYFENKVFIIGKSLRIGPSIPIKLINNHLACCSLINFDFLLLQTTHFDKNIIFPFLVFTTFGFLLSGFFIHFKQ